jgi:hypothetical protein
MLLAQGNREDADECTHSPLTARVGDDAIMEANVEFLQGEDIIWTGRPTWTGTVCFSGVADAYDVAARSQPHPEGCRPLGTP